MVKVGWHYKPFRSKSFSGERGTSTSFSVNAGNRDESEWYNIWIPGEYEVEKGDGTEIVLSAITGVKTKMYNGTKYVDIYAEGTVTKDGKQAFGKTDAEYKKVELESGMADLPF